MKTTLFSLFALALLGILFIGGGVAMSDSYHEPEHENYDRWEHLQRRSTGVAATTSPLYLEECGSCHMAYPAGLLPVSSWRRIMANLDDHFGDNAELDAQTATQITDYLIMQQTRRSIAVLNK